MNLRSEPETFLDVFVRFSAFLGDAGKLLEAPSFVQDLTASRGSGWRGLDIGTLGAETIENVVYLISGVTCVLNQLNKFSFNIF